MSDSALNLPPDGNAIADSTIRIYAVVFSVGVVCSLAIVTVHEITRPIIARNKVAFRQASIPRVLPNAASIEAYRFDEATGQFHNVSSDANGSDLVFAGFDQSRQLVGLAIEARGMGYQDNIGLLYGYSFDRQAIVGVQVLESRETPGLGDRIETDMDFARNFDRLDVALSPDGAQPARPIEFVKPGKKTAPWQIDGISGATISSRAVAEILRDSTAYWIPLVYPRRSDFLQSGGGE